MKKFIKWSLCCLLVGQQLADYGVAQQLLVDFGASSAANQYNTSQFPGWNSVVISASTSYTSAGGVSGTTLLISPADPYSNFTCISGSPRSFVYGERIYLTWYNSSGVDAVFNPLISFSDADQPVDAPAEPNWFIVGQQEEYSLYPGDSILMYYDITNSANCGPMIPASGGLWSLLNICVNSTQTGIILDKIKIGTADTIAPPAPSGLNASVGSSNSLGLTWNAVSDNVGGDGLSHYEIWVNGLLYGISDSSAFTIFLLESSHLCHIQVLAVDLCGNRSALSTAIDVSTAPSVSMSGRMDPLTDLEYLGAFRMPAGGTGSDFGYMDTDLAFFADGDPLNTDLFPGSIFLAGNATYRYVAEISIPEPVISTGKNVDDLNRASFLQDFADIRSPGQPIVPFSWSKGPALEYIPAQSGQSNGYLYTCFGDYYQWNGERLKSFGAARTDFSNPSPQGGWFIGSETDFSLPYYMSFITFNFEAAYAIDGHLLIAGGSRPGDIHHGPTLIAYSPWNDGIPLPADGTHLNFSELLMYDADAGTHRLNGETYNDFWNGGAWLRQGSKQAVVISGAKGRGKEWYGYNNGETTFNVMFNIPIPTEPEDHGPRQSCYEPMLLFYDPVDLQAVVDGGMDVWEPQPYAVRDLSACFFSPDADNPSYGSKFRGAGGMAYDAQHQLLYVLEQNVCGMDSTEAIIHMFRVNPIIGLDEAQAQTEVRVFAENGNVNVIWPEVTGFDIHVYDMHGKCIFSSDAVNGSKYSFAMPPHASGLYFIQLHSPKDTYTKKLFVE